MPMGRGRKGSGVEPRANDYRIRFTWAGKRYVMPIALKPCAAHFAAVKRQAAEIQRAVEEGTFTFERFFPDSVHSTKEAPVIVTWGTYAQRWRDARSELSEAQRDKDRLAALFWAAHVGGNDADPAKVVPSELEAKVGKAMASRGASYRNNMVSALRGIFDMWVKDDTKARANPAAGIGFAKRVKGQPDPYDAEEVEVILADMEKHYDERIVCYYGAAFFAGFRPEEEIILRWTKIDARTRSGLVDVAKHRGEEKATKNYEVRTVEFNDRAWEYIQRMRKWTEFSTHKCVFENPRTAQPWASEADQRDLYWTPTLKRLRMRHRRAYQTRSTCATMMLIAGLEPAYCAGQLGHSVAVFFSKYAKWINGKRNEEQRAKMNRVVARAAIGEKVA